MFNTKVARNKIIVEYIHIPHVFLIDYNVNVTDLQYFKFIFVL